MVAPNHRSSCEIRLDHKMPKPASCVTDLTLLHLNDLVSLVME